VQAEYTKWYVFDLINDELKNLPYFDRLNLLRNQVDYVKSNYSALESVIEVIPTFTCENLKQLLDYEQEFLDAGYEGIIIRDINGKYKFGRSTVKEGLLLRIKRFIEEECIVIGITEGETNNNEKQTNELGKSFRSSHAENKVLNGMIGNLTCQATKDIYNLKPNEDQLLFPKGFEFTVSPGSLNHQQRNYYFENPNEILGKVIKFKFFPKGIKDKPRFPNFVSFRSKEDM
jgi:DNA ligase-1